MGKPMKFRAACIILLSMGVAATAQTASRYEQLVAKAENGDADTDYTALRHAYAESTGYDPYGVKWRAPFTAAWAAFQAKDCATALARSEEARKIDYTAVSVHAFRADCFRQAGDGAQRPMQKRFRGEGGRVRGHGATLGAPGGFFAKILW